MEKAFSNNVFLKTKGLPYQPVFDDLESIAKELEDQITRPSTGDGD